MTEEYAEHMENLPPLPESPRVIITPVPSTRLSPPRTGDYTPTSRLPSAAAAQPIAQAGPPPAAQPIAQAGIPPPLPTKPVRVTPLKNEVGSMQAGWYYYCPPNMPQPNLPNMQQVHFQPPPPAPPCEQQVEELTEEQLKAQAKRKRIIKWGVSAGVVVAIFFVLLIVYFYWSGHTDYWYENTADYYDD